MFSRLARLPSHCHDQLQEDVVQNQQGPRLALITYAVSGSQVTIRRYALEFFPVWFKFHTLLSLVRFLPRLPELPADVQGYSSRLSDTFSDIVP